MVYVYTEERGIQARLELREEKLRTSSTILSVVSFALAASLLQQFHIYHITLSSFRNFRIRTNTFLKSLEKHRLPMHFVDTTLASVTLALIIAQSTALSLSTLNSPHMKSYGLSEIFPTVPNLSSIWSSNSSFRSSVRLATRKSLFHPPPPPPPSSLEKTKNYKKKLNFLRQIQVDLSSTANGRWHVNPTESLSYPHLDSAFAKHSIRLTGLEFISTLTSLTRTAFESELKHIEDQPLRGSWLDISTNYDGPLEYGWHRGEPHRKRRQLTLRGSETHEGCC